MSQEKTQTSLVEKLIRKNLMYARTMTVGKVVAILENGYVDVDPQIQMVNYDRETNTETNVDINKLVRVPIGFYKAGTFIVTFPMDIGDEGLLIFSDRSLDVWKSLGTKRPPDSARMHDLSDAVFIPFPTSTPGAIQNFDTENLVIGKEDGTSFIKINKADGAIQMTSALSITVAAPDMTFTADNKITMTAPDIEMNASTLFAVNGVVDITGTTHIISSGLTVDNDVAGANFTGTEFTAGSITLTGHTHLYAPGPGSPTPTDPPA